MRPISWERLIELQGLQREDLLRQYMEKQQRIARAKLDSAAASASGTGGAQPPGRKGTDDGHAVGSVDPETGRDGDGVSDRRNRRNRRPPLSAGRSVCPTIEYPRLAVWVGYPNVGPEEMESIITDPLENALSGIPNLERMTSSSQEGRSVVRLEFARGTNLDEAANDIRAALDRLRNSLPIEASQPGIWKFDPNAREIVTIAATSTRDLEQLTRVLEREIAQRYEQIPGVGSIADQRRRQPGDPGPAAA